MKISYIPRNTVNPTTNSVPNNGSWNTGTPMQVIELADLLELQTTFSPNSPKKTDGCFFPIEKATLGDASSAYYSDLKQNGLAFVDLDHLTVEIAETIYNNFEVLAGKCPMLYSVCFSSSYYLKRNLNDVGLHITVGIQPGDGNDYYKYSRMALAVLVSVVKKELGIDLIAYHKEVYNKTKQERLTELKKTNSSATEKDVKGDSVLDSHNLIPGQRFYCHYSVYKINKWFDGKTFVNEEFYNKNLDQVKKALYGIISFNTRGEVELTNYNYTISNTSVTNKFQLDFSKEYPIANYLSFLGWKEADIVNLLLSIDSRDSVAYKQRHNQTLKSHFEQIAKTARGRKVAQYEVDKAIEILTLAGIDIKAISSSSASIVIKNGEWLADYGEQIFKFIDKNRVSYIVAPTGVGKTTFINDTLAQHYNAVVIVPFNVTNQLYNKLVEVSSSTDNGISSDKPLVMIWDQFLKYKEQLKSRTVIIDEAHCLFNDRSYRDSAVRLLKFFRSVEFTGKIVLVSATPEGEANVLKANELRFETSKQIIPTTWVETRDALVQEYYCIVNALKFDKYDRIVLFDDMYAKKIRERLIYEGIIPESDIAYLRSETKNSSDFIDIRSTELLKKKLTISTCVAFNGLNFKNEKEKVLIVTSLKNGLDTYSKIVQELGRIRNSNVVAHIYYDPDIQENSTTLEVRAAIAQQLQAFAEKEGFDDRLLSYCRDLTDLDVAEARIELQKYNFINAKSDIILEKLKQYNYIKIKVKKLDTEKKSFRLMIKKKESDQMVNDINEGTFGDKYASGEYYGEYNGDWAAKLEYLLEKNGWLDLEIIQKLLKSKHKNKLIETAIDNIDEIIRICNMTDEQWHSYIDANDKIIEILEQSVSMLKDYQTKRKHNIAIREKWMPVVIKSNYQSELFFPEIFEQIIAEQEASSHKTLEENSKGGQASKRIKVSDTVYESRQEAANKLNISPNTITRWLKSGKAQTV